jgi:hypothetical protein
MSDSYYLPVLLIGGLIGAAIAWNRKATPNSLTVSEKPISDFRAMDRLAKLMESGIRHDAFYDVSMLQYPKYRVMAVAETLFLSPETSDEYCQFLVVALSMLPLFRVGIGSKPFFWFDEKMTSVGESNLSDPKVKQNLLVLAAQNERRWPIVERLQADAKREQEEIDHRIKALEHLRATRPRWQNAAEKLAELSSLSDTVKTSTKPATIQTILSDFGKLTEDMRLNFSQIYDAKILPYPKRQIFEAINAALATRLQDDDVDDLAILLEWLSHFQLGVGNEEIYDLDEDDLSGPGIKKIVEARWRDREHYDKIMEQWYGGMRVFYSRGAITKMPLGK